MQNISPKVSSIISEPILALKVLILVCSELVVFCCTRLHLFGSFGLKHWTISRNLRTKFPQYVQVKRITKQNLYIGDADIFGAGPSQPVVHHANWMLLQTRETTC